MGSVINKNKSILKSLEDLGIMLVDHSVFTAHDLHQLEELPELLEMMAHDGSLDEQFRDKVKSAIGLYKQNQFT